MNGAKKKKIDSKRKTENKHCCCVFVPSGPSFIQLMLYSTANDSKRFRFALLAQWICLLFFQSLSFRIEQYVLQRRFCVFALKLKANDGRTLLLFVVKASRTAQFKLAGSEIVEIPKKIIRSSFGTENCFGYIFRVSQRHYFCQIHIFDTMLIQIVVFVFEK